MSNRVSLLACECLVLLAVFSRILIRRNFYLTVTIGRSTNAFAAAVVVPLFLIALAGMMSLVLLVKMFATGH